MMHRHPLAMRALLRRTLVMTFAYPRDLLAPVLPPGLVLDGWADRAFLAIALVRTERLRPAGFPAALGGDFFLCGYRIFTRCRREDGRTLRGLYILRSDTDSRLVAWGGNALTHYGYRRCQVRELWNADAWEVRVATPNGEADLRVRARLAAALAPPPGSPFADLAAARRFAGPLPHTFAYEPQSDRIVVVRGVRSHWNPRPVPVELQTAAFLDAPPFRSDPPVLASAFYVEDVPYLWQRGWTLPVVREAA